MAVASDEPVLLAEVGVFDRATVEAIVDDLVGTGMHLPLGSGAGLFAWAYEEGLLP
jgi:hypothetical protein